jgi:AcrR family transcriptional regulator
VPRSDPPDDDAAGGLPRLPPGRHGLPREFVAQNQRDRLAAGIIAAVAERGYHDATITEIATAAGVSRRTFYGYFSSKEECFFDTYETIAAHLTGAMEAAGARQPNWPDRVRAKLNALLENLAANPDLVRFCFIAPAGAGGDIATRYRTSLDRLLGIITEGMPPPPETRQPSEAAEHGLMGGIVALVVRKVKAGEGEQLPALLPDLLELVLTPYLGRTDALLAARRAK